MLSFIFAGGAVKRFHVVPTVRTQTVAAHSFGVAWLVYLLTEGNASKELLLAALAHDLAEQETGDVPSHTKRYTTIGLQLEELERTCRVTAGMPNFTLTPEEERTLNLADHAEGMLFCIAERQLGNKNVKIVYERYHSYMLKAKLHGAAEFSVFQEIENAWCEACK